LPGLLTLIVVVFGWLVHELRRVPARTGSREPLTDIAAKGDSMTVDAPWRRAAAENGHVVENQPAQVAPPAKRVPPRAMPDPTHPPQWTKPLAVPTAPKPPDPFVPPPIAVDPERGHHSNVQ